MRLVHRCIVEAIDCYHERDFSALEEVYRRKTTLQPSGVREDDRSQRLVSELIPHEPKTLLTWSPEEIEYEIGIDRDTPKIQGNCRCGLVLNARQIINAGAQLAEHLLSAQWPDLANRPHHGCLANAKSARYQDFDRSGG